MKTKPSIPGPHGDRLYPLRPTASDLHSDPLILCDEIAAGLAQVLRCNGRTRHEYRVAQHAVLFSELAGGRAVRHGLRFLLHDAAEAYLGDTIKPLKDACPELIEIEDCWLAAIFARFGIGFKDAADLADFEACKQIYDPLALYFETLAFDVASTIPLLGLTPIAPVVTADYRRIANSVLTSGRPWGYRECIDQFTVKFHEHILSRN